MPDTTLTIPASVSSDITIGLTFKSWVRVHDVGYQGMIAVMTDGMRRFGLPELRLGPASPKLREELITLLNGMAFRIWSDLIASAQDTPKATGLLHLRLPAGTGRDGHSPPGPGPGKRRPNRGGMFALIGLQFDPGQNEDSGAA